MARGLDVTTAYERLLRGRWLLGGARVHRVRSRCGGVHVLELAGRGKLPPLVLLHGFSASATSQFTDMLGALRPHFSRIIAPDLPGHGQSDRHALSPTVMVEGVVDVLDAVVREPAVLFASSLSGAIAVRATQARRHIVRALMLCSPTGAPVPDAELAELVESLRIDSHQKALAFMRRVFVKLPTAPLHHAYAMAIRQQFGRPHLVDLIGRISRHDFLRPDEVASLTLPVSLVWGEQERLLSSGQHAFWRAHLPRSAHFVSPESYGHAPFLEQPKDLARRIVEFARQARLGRSESPRGHRPSSKAP